MIPHFVLFLGVYFVPCCLFRIRLVNVPSRGSGLFLYFQCPFVVHHTLAGILFLVLSWMSWQYDIEFSWHFFGSSEIFVNIKNSSISLKFDFICVFQFQVVGEINFHLGFYICCWNNVFLISGVVIGLWAWQSFSRRCCRSWINWAER